MLPHEHTFRGPKEDRLKLLRALRLNTSPVFLIYADARREIAPLLTRALSEPPEAEFAGADGHPQRLVRIDDPDAHRRHQRRACPAEKLYVADGHHRYETALALPRRVRAGAAWTGDGRRTSRSSRLAAVERSRPARASHPPPGGR